MHECSCDRYPTILFVRLPNSNCPTPCKGVCARGGRWILAGRFSQSADIYGQFGWGTKHEEDSQVPLAPRMMRLSTLCSMVKKTGGASEFSARNRPQFAPRPRLRALNQRMVNSGHAVHVHIVARLVFYDLQVASAIGVADIGRLQKINYALRQHVGIVR